jgi:hypothetical protein
MLVRETENLIFTKNEQKRLNYVTSTNYALDSKLFLFSALENVENFLLFFGGWGWNFVVSHFLIENPQNILLRKLSNSVDRCATSLPSGLQPLRKTTQLQEETIFLFIKLD